MVIDNFHSSRTLIGPDKADPVLIVDPDTMLPAPVSRERLEPITGRDAKIGQAGRIADPLVRRFVNRYLPALKARYQPQLVLVFGSRSRGDALAESDLDLVIVSERFRGIPFVERASRLIDDLDLALPADILCYTPEEFARKRRELGIVSLAADEGVRL